MKAPTSVCVTVVTLFASTLGAVPSEDPATIEAGDRVLFDGRDMSQWEGAGAPAETCWRVDGDNLVGLPEKGPWLRSREQYADFNLKLEYQVEPGANSGVYVRVPPDGEHHRQTSADPPAGFEVQIIDDTARKYDKLKDYQYCASVYDLAGATHRVGKPAGEWNTLEINCVGSHTTVTHNGTQVVNLTPESHPLIVLRQPKGYIGLQNHGGGVRFRNIRIGPPRE